MRWDGFARSLGFAALAAGAWPLFALLVAPALGAGAALRAWLVLAATLYVAGMARRRRRAWGAAAGVGALGAALALAAPGLGALAVGLALLLGVARSTLRHRARPARALALEAALVFGGLALAHASGGPGLLGVALALWSFFLVQSLYFLVGGGTGRDEDAGSLDAFELARHRLEALFEEE